MEETTTKKLHIALVGDQSAPVFHGIVATNPDKVILICSDKTLAGGQRLQEMLGVPIEIMEFSPTDLKSISESIDELQQRISPEDEVSVNLQSGTKHWSLMFMRAFAGNPKAQLCLIDQNNIFSDLNTLETKEVVFDMDINFQLYGNPLKKYTPFEEYTEDDADVAKEIESIRRINFNQFNKLTTVLTKEQQHKLRSEPSGSWSCDGAYVEWESSSYAKISLFNKFNCRYETKELESENAVRLLFNAGWFEYKVARLLSKWSKAKEIRMNCIFEEKKQGSQNAKNEADIIVNTGKKLLFVECKTQITNTTDIDKFRTVVTNYGGDASKALFVTDAKMEGIAIEKCDESDIAHFSLKGEGGESFLFTLLDKEIGKINKR